MKTALLIISIALVAGSLIFLIKTLINRQKHRVRRIGNGYSNDMASWVGTNVYANDKDVADQYTITKQDGKLITVRNGKPAPDGTIRLENKFKLNDGDDDPITVTFTYQSENYHWQILALTGLLIIGVVLIVAGFLL